MIKMIKEIKGINKLKAVKEIMCSRVSTDQGDHLISRATSAMFRNTEGVETAPRISLR